ncbi:acyl carrier protein [Aeromicrobium endophyticum]|uniref:Acyl carrier protein n=1 Tax=Aeromicrobium endophyticum TaxID=2292704 RepID=A0A371P3N2_9ACTN|nr:acyl carrier protein [Aeromicrobium endophyticum]REK70547.1 acyl carrier protein [Aeromicrobium endophyticum]
MPSPSSVHEQLTDILVRVVSCPADAVVPTAILAELGTDSLTIVEVGEELGRRFGVRLSDAAIDSMTTVQDAIDAVIAQSAADRPAPAPAPSAKPAPIVTAAPEVRKRRLGSFAATFIFFGLIIGGVLGLGGAALVSASGIADVDLPPIGASPTPTPTPEAVEETTPAPASPTEDPKPTITTSSERVSPGERFLLSGAFPGSTDGQDLQVEVKDGGSGSWDVFPIQTKVRDGGIFRTELYTSRTGVREFRVVNKASGQKTPSIKVEIG